MTRSKDKRQPAGDTNLINSLKRGEPQAIKQFFYDELSFIINHIRQTMFDGRADYDELVNELYIYMSRENWKKFDSYEARNGSRLRTWMIPVAWRFFLGVRERLEQPQSTADKLACIDETDEIDQRIQIAIDVTATLSKMTNKRYAQILNLLYLEGHSNDDVAQLLSLDKSNLYNLKHRAIKQFIEIYKKY